MDAEILWTLARLAGLALAGFLVITVVIEPLLSGLDDETADVVLTVLTAALVIAAAAAFVWLLYERQMPGARWTAPGLSRTFEGHGG